MLWPYSFARKQTKSKPSIKTQQSDQDLKPGAFPPNASHEYGSSLGSRFALQIFLGKNFGQQVLTYIG